MTRPRLIALFTFAILLILGAGAYLLLTSSSKQIPNQENRANESAVPTTAPDSNQVESENEASTSRDAAFFDVDIPETLVGEHSGSALLLNSGLEFPEARFSATEGLRFELEASGFDLALLADESLAIEENTYPQLRFVMGGTISEVATKEFVLSLGDFTPEFYVLDLDRKSVV